MSTPATQKVLYLTEKQGAFALRQADVPSPASGQILVRIQSAALNPIDWKIQAYGIFVEKFPAILGSDIAGTVVAVGDGVTKFAVGDRVVYQAQTGTQASSYQEYSAVDVNFVAKIPPNISFDQASTVPLAFATAAFGLYGPKWDRGGAELTAPWLDSGRGKYAGQAIIIFAGSSSVGQFAIQLAKLSGFSPIFATSSTKNFDLLKSLGATHPLDRNLSAPKIVEAFKAVTNHPLKIAYDAFGSDAAIQNAVYDLLAPGGKLVTVLQISVDKEKITSDKAIINTFGSPHAPPNKELGESIYANLTELLRSGDIKPNPVEYAAGGLGSIPAQLQRLKNNEISGKKIVVRPTETV